MNDQELIDIINKLKRRFKLAEEKLERVNALCAIGIHKWLKFGQFIICPWASISECLRCHKRKADYGYACVYQNPPTEGWNDYLELNWTIDMQEPSK